MAMNTDEFNGSPADQYHLASCNSSTTKGLPSQFQINYEMRILDLVRESPLRIDNATERIALDVDRERVSMSIEEAITSRESIRQYGTDPITLSQLAKLLYLGNGIRKLSTPDKRDYIHRRNVPSAGNLGSVEVYCISLNVEGLKQGIYHFDALNHELELVRSGDFTTWLKEFVFYQLEAAEAAAMLVLTSQQARISQKYGIRAYRMGLLDAGHVSQNIFLAATGMNLAVWVTGGFVDDELNTALGLDGLDQCALLTLCLGNKRT